MFFPPGEVLCFYLAESELIRTFRPLLLVQLLFPLCVYHKWKDWPTYRVARGIPIFLPSGLFRLWRDDNLTVLTNKLSSIRHTKGRHTTLLKLLILGMNGIPAWHLFILLENNGSQISQTHGPATLQKIETGQLLTLPKIKSHSPYYLIPPSLHEREDFLAQI